MISGSRFAIAYPFTAPDVYNVADAINLASADLLPGDILLIEQQGWSGDTYTPSRSILQSSMPSRPLWPRASW